MLGTRWCCGCGADGLRPPNFGFLERAGCQIWGFGQGWAAQFQALRGYRTAGSPHVPNAASLRGETCRNRGEIGVKSGRNWGEIASFAAPPAAQAAAVGLERGKGSRPPAAGALQLILGGKIWPKIRCRGQARCRCSAFSPGTAEGPRCRPASRSRAKSGNDLEQNAGRGGRREGREARSGRRAPASDQAPVNRGGGVGGWARGPWAPPVSPGIVGSGVLGRREVLVGRGGRMERGFGGASGTGRNWETGVERGGGIRSGAGDRNRCWEPELVLGA